MPINTHKYPAVTLTAYDAEGNELTSTIEIEVDKDAEAIELWQHLRKCADKWIDKYDNIK